MINSQSWPLRFVEQKGVNPVLQSLVLCHPVDSTLVRQFLQFSHSVDKLDMLRFAKFLVALDQFYAEQSGETAKPLFVALRHLDIPVFAAINPEFGVFERISALLGNYQFQDFLNSAMKGGVHTLVAASAMRRDPGQIDWFSPLARLDYGFSAAEVVNAYEHMTSCSHKAFLDDKDRLAHLFAIPTTVAPFSYSRCGSVDLVADNLFAMLEIAVSALFGKLSEVERRLMIKGLLLRFMIAFPDAWVSHGIMASDYLGEPMIDAGGERQAMVINGPVGKGLARTGNGKSSILNDLIIGRLAEIDPSILNAENMLREGSRMRSWVDRAKGIEGAGEHLGSLIKAGIKHPILQRAGVVDLLDGEACKRALHDYLERGGVARERMAISILERFPFLKQSAFESCRGHSQLIRLDRISPLDDDQRSQLSSLTKRKMLNAELDL